MSGKQIDSDDAINWDVVNRLCKSWPLAFPSESMAKDSYRWLREFHVFLRGLSRRLMVADTYDKQEMLKRADFVEREGIEERRAWLRNAYSNYHAHLLLAVNTALDFEANHIFRSNPQIHLSNYPGALDRTLEAFDLIGLLVEIGNEWLREAGRDQSLAWKIQIYSEFSEKIKESGLRDKLKTIATCIRSRLLHEGQCGLSGGNKQPQTPNQSSGEKGKLRDFIERYCDFGNLTPRERKNRVRQTKEQIDDLKRKGKIVLPEPAVKPKRGQAHRYLYTDLRSIWPEYVKNHPHLPSLK